MEGAVVKGQGEAPPGVVCVAGGASCFVAAPGDGERVAWRRVVRLICAGWLPQDGAFGGSVSACLRSSVATREVPVAGRSGMLAHSPVAGLLAALLPIRRGGTKFFGSVVVH